MIYELDKTIGQIIQAIKAEGLEDNTIIVFTSDVRTMLARQS